MWLYNTVQHTYHLGNLGFLSMLLAAPLMLVVLATVTHYLLMAVASWPGENINRREKIGKTWIAPRLGWPKGLSQRPSHTLQCQKEIRENLRADPDSEGSWLSLSSGERGSLALGDFPFPTGWYGPRIDYIVVPEINRPIYSPTV